MEGKDNVPDDSPPDDASAAGGSVAAGSIGGTVDLSDLFNASALTNLFSGLQHQLRHQQNRIAQLEAAQLEHAAEKEIFEIQQAEFRAEMARKSEAFDKKVKEAMRNAGGDVAILRREFNSEKGFRRLLIARRGNLRSTRGSHRRRGYSVDGSARPCCPATRRA